MALECRWAERTNEGLIPVACGEAIRVLWQSGMPKETEANTHGQFR
jgi:hypothetical protein